MVLYAHESQLAQYFSFKLLTKVPQKVIPGQTKGATVHKTTQDVFYFLGGYKYANSTSQINDILAQL